MESALASRKNKSTKLSVDEVLDWARPLAVTLDELHEMDYVHSNVRPGVIFLGQKRQVLLGDFITELAIQRLGAFKQAISSLDISDHLAPEYIKSNYNESYDQYLLATIVYEALAGRSHFHNPGSSEAYRRQVATKFPEPLLTHRPELVGASRILGKALERNPVKRFATCREFVNQLGSAQVNPVHAYANPGAYTPGLTITTSNNCTSTYCDSLIATSGCGTCHADYTYNINVASVSFSAVSTASTTIGF